MSKRPQESDIEFIKALAELLRANDLTEIEVNRDYGDDDALTVRVARQAAPVVTQAAGAAPDRRRPCPGGRRAGAAARAPPTRRRIRAWCPRRWSAPPTCRPSPRRRPSSRSAIAVTEGQTILIIEAMKTMNQIAAPRAGRVKRILVADGQPVEFGAPLIILE